MAKKKHKTDANWEVLPAGEMRRKYGLYAENRPLIKLVPERVPEPLRKLIPLAEKFGISDDLIREDFFAKTPKTELKQLKMSLAENDTPQADSVIRKCQRKPRPSTTMGIGTDGPYLP